MSSCVTPAAFGKLQETSTYEQHRGPVRTDVIAHPHSSFAYLEPDCTLIFTLVFVLLLHCDLRQANASVKLVRVAELGLPWLFFTEVPEVGGMSQTQSSTCLNTLLR